METVPRMQRVTLRSPRDVHDFIDVQIAFARRRRTERGIPSVAVFSDADRAALHGDGRDAPFAVGSRDPDGGGGIL